MTYGNRKSVDVYAIGDGQRRALKIEVKTSQKKNFVTKIFQKGLANDPDAPDFWVLVQICNEGNGNFVEKFFVLRHVEICRLQAARNRAYVKKYKKHHHGKKPDTSRGVDNVTVADVEPYKNQWFKIVDDQRLKGRNS